MTVAHCSDVYSISANMASAKRVSAADVVMFCGTRVQNVELAGGKYDIVLVYTVPFGGVVSRRSVTVTLGRYIIFVHDTASDSLIGMKGRPLATCNEKTYAEFAGKPVHWYEIVVDPSVPVDIAKAGL